MRIKYWDSWKESDAVLCVILWLQKGVKYQLTRITKANRTNKPKRTKKRKTVEPKTESGWRTNKHSCLICARKIRTETPNIWKMKSNVTSNRSSYSTRMNGIDDAGTLIKCCQCVNRSVPNFVQIFEMCNISAWHEIRTKDYVWSDDMVYELPSPSLTFPIRSISEHVWFFQINPQR